MSGKLTMELKLRITYDIFGDTLNQEILDILVNAGEYLRDNGLLTQEADVIMDDCAINVRTINKEG